MLNADLKKQIKRGKVAQVYNQGSYFISSLLDLAFKLNNKQRKIHSLSYPTGCSINCHIPKNLGSLEYTTFDKAKYQVSNARPGRVMIKGDSKRRILSYSSGQAGLVAIRFFVKWKNIGWQISSFYLKNLILFVWFICQKSTLDHSNSAFIKDHIPLSWWFFYNPRKHGRSPGIWLPVWFSIQGVRSRSYSAQKRWGYTVSFLRIEFDTLKIETRFPKAKLKKAIANVKQILVKKSSATLEEFQSSVGLLLFAAKLVIPGHAFLRRIYNVLSQTSKFLQ